MFQRLSYFGKGLECFSKANDCSCLPSTQSIVKGGQFCKALGFDLGDLFPSAKWPQNVTGMRPKLESFHRQTDEILENVINEHKKEKYTKEKDDQGHNSGHFRCWSGIRSEELDMTEEFGVSVRRTDDLLLFLSVYHPLNVK
ncbi:cytochrome P450 71D11 [Trifolium repens]|nr:cytochrome P450 71D11 [Trifolium repens]